MAKQEKEQMHQIELTETERNVLLSMMRSPQISVPTQLAEVIVALQQKLAATRIATEG